MTETINAAVQVMTKGTQARPHDDDMPAEIDFSEAARGEYFKPNARLYLPVYLEAEVQANLAARAKARGIEVGQLVKVLLKKDIELIEAAGAAGVRGMGHTYSARG